MAAFRGIKHNQSLWFETSTGLVRSDLKKIEAPPAALCASLKWAQTACMRRFGPVAGRRGILSFILKSAPMTARLFENPILAEPQALILAKTERPIPFLILEETAFLALLGGNGTASEVAGGQ